MTKEEHAVYGEDIERLPSEVSEADRIALEVQADIAYQLTRIADTLGGNEPVDLEQEP